MIVNINIYVLREEDGDSLGGCWWGGDGVLSARAGMFCDLSTPPFVCARDREDQASRKLSRKRQTTRQHACQHRSAAPRNESSGYQYSLQKGKWCLCVCDREKEGLREFL